MWQLVALLCRNWLVHVLGKQPLCVDMVHLCLKGLVESHINRLHKTSAAWRNKEHLNNTKVLDGSGDRSLHVDRGRVQ